MEIKKLARFWCVAGFASTALNATAQTSRSTLPPASAPLHQEQQIDVAKERALIQPDVFAAPGEDKYSQLRLPVEARCFKIDEIDWRGAESFPWLPAQSPVAGACVGSRGLQVLRDWGEIGRAHV